MENIKNRKITLLLVLGLSLFSILILAGGLTDLPFRPGKSLNLLAWLMAELAGENQSELPEVIEVPPQTDLLPDIGDAMLDSLIEVFWLLAIVSILFLIVSPSFRRELLRAIALIIPMVILLPRIAKLLSEQSEEGQGEEVGGFWLGEENFPQAPDYVNNPPEWIYILINIILIAIILFAIFIIWRRLRPKPDSQSVVVNEIRRALSSLESGSELKDVVMACYAQMCQGLQDNQHIKRHQAMTPREFEIHLSKAGIANVHIRQLTRLFEGVRYGGIATDQATENEAKLCLQSILEVYGGHQ